MSVRELSTVSASSRCLPYSPGFRQNKNKGVDDTFALYAGPEPDR